MDLALVRSSARPDGIFSNLLTMDEHEVCMTLEHAFDVDGAFVPKIYPGSFECVRGLHRLHGMDHDFETFEITGVAGHSKLLFHCGNYNKDSEGCILVGDAIASDGGSELLTNSRAAFARFMNLQSGVAKFLLKVY